MESKSDAPDTLKMFHQDVGVPPTIHTDNAKELVEGDFAKFNRKVGTKQTSTEPHTPNQNRAELCMREFKKRIWRLMAKKKSLSDSSVSPRNISPTSCLSLRDP